MQFDRSHVYRVESAEDDTVLLALVPEVRKGAICWFDTVRERMKLGTTVADEPDRFVFRAQDGATYVFRLLSLEEYNRTIRQRVELSPTFANEGELHAFYTRQFL